MSYNLKNNKGIIQEPMYFQKDKGITNVDNVVSAMTQKAEKMGVPAIIKADVIKEGGLLGHTYPCVVIEHPNPPRRYFTDVYVFLKDIVNFYYFGESKANTATNRANIRSNTLTGKILNSISGSSELEWQEELNWHEQIYGIFDSFIE